MKAGLRLIGDLLVGGVIGCFIGTTVYIGLYGVLLHAMRDSRDAQPTAFFCGLAMVPLFAGLKAWLGQRAKTTACSERRAPYEP